MDSVYPQSTVKHVSSDPIEKVLFISTKAISSYHLTLMHAKYPGTIHCYHQFSPHLNQVFQNVPVGQLDFPTYSIGAAQKLIRNWN